MKNFLEVELKFKLDEPAKAIEVLNEQAESGPSFEQKETYYNLPHRDFLHPKLVSEWLRIRETDKGASICYKNWHKEKNAHSVVAQEYESFVGDSEALAKIFEVIDLKKVIVVEKKRQT